MEALNGKHVGLGLLVAWQLISLSSWCQVSGGQTADSAGVDLDGGILYGDGYAYYLHAAEGWKMDDTLAMHLEVNAAFYPKAYAASTSPVIVQSLIWYKSEGAELVDVMSLYEEAFLSDHPGAHMTVCSSLTTSAGGESPVRYLTADSQCVYQRIAFNDAPGVVVVIMLSSHYKSELERYIEQFEETVESYLWLTNDVRTLQDVGDSSDSSR